MTFDDFQELVKRGVVHPYLNAYLDRYSGLDYIDPLLELKPPTYIRFAGFFNAVGGGRYYEEYRKGLQLFRRKLRESASRRRWSRIYNRAGQRAFETKVSFDYARLSILYPTAVDEALRFPTVAERAEHIVAKDAQLVDPFTNAFDQFWKFNPGRSTPALNAASSHPFDPLVGKLIVDKFEIRYPGSLSLDEVVAITQDPVWRRGAKLMSTVTEAVDTGAEEVGNHALALSSTWGEIADALEANRRRVRGAASVIANVSLGVTGFALAFLTSQWEAAEFLFDRIPAAEDFLRDQLSGILKVRRPVHCAAAWDYHLAVSRALGRA